MARRRRKGTAAWDALGPDEVSTVLANASPLALGSIACSCKQLKDLVAEIAKTRLDVDRFTIAAAQAGVAANCVATGLVDWSDMDGMSCHESMNNLLLSLGARGELRSMTVAEIISACHNLADAELDLADVRATLGAVTLLGAPWGSRYCGVAMVKVLLGARDGHLIRGLFTVDLQLPPGVRALPGCVLWVLDGCGNPFRSLVGPAGIFSWRRPPPRAGRVLSRYVSGASLSSPFAHHLRVEDRAEMVAINLTSVEADFCTDRGRTFANAHHIMRPATRSWLVYDWSVHGGGSVRSLMAYLAASARMTLPTVRSLHSFLTSPAYHYHVYHQNDFRNLAEALEPVWPAAPCLQLFCKDEVFGRRSFLSLERTAVSQRAPPRGDPEPKKKKLMFLPVKTDGRARWMSRHDLKWLRGHPSLQHERLATLRALVDREDVSIEQVQSEIWRALGLQMQP